MLISKCHLNVNVDAKNEKFLICHFCMFLSRINSFGTNLNRLRLARRVNHTDVVHIQWLFVVRSKSLDPSPCILTGACWDDWGLLFLVIKFHFYSTVILLRVVRVHLNLIRLVSFAEMTVLLKLTKRSENHPCHANKNPEISCLQNAIKSPIFWFYWE